MILLIASTNRPGSRTNSVALAVKDLFNALTREEVKLLSLADFHDLPPTAYSNPSIGFTKQVNQSFIAADRIVFIIPEYNGSFPGILKYVIDLASIVDYKGLFSGKSTLLIGIAEGQGGNQLGLQHFASIVQHMGGRLHSRNIFFPQIHQKMNAEGELVEPARINLKKQINKWINFP